jgi:hypothetical protein
MRNVQWNQIGLSVLSACVLSLGLMSPALVSAGQNKVDVCHSEGNGSYHLINIAEPAYPSHVSHGDAGVGEPVPGNEGFVFDEDCNLVEAVSCPCDYSDTNYIALGGGVSGACYLVQSDTKAVLSSNVSFFVDDNVDECIIVVDGHVIVVVNGLSDGEMSACVQEIVSTASVLGIPGC